MVLRGSKKARGWWDKPILIKFHSTNGVCACAYKCLCVCTVCPTMFVMYVYLCVCVWVCLCACTQYVRMFVCMCCMSGYISVYESICVCMAVYVFLCVFVWVWLCISFYVSVSVYMWVMRSCCFVVPDAMRLPWSCFHLDLDRKGFHAPWASPGYSSRQQPVEHILSHTHTYSSMSA